MNYNIHVTTAPPQPGQLHPTEYLVEFQPPPPAEVADEVLADLLHPRYRGNDGSISVGNFSEAEVVQRSRFLRRPSAIRIADYERESDDIMRKDAYIVGIFVEGSLRKATGATTTLFADGRRCK
jgi:hypothetical protein